MSGLAVAIDWEHPVHSTIVHTMLDMAPYRSAGGSSVVTVGNAAIGETRSVASGDPAVVVDGDLAIAGDLRLWNIERLRSRAGGNAATKGMGVRRLLLAAYRRHGLEFLEAVDGDFAFVIWDAGRKTAIAARDRFSVKPLFYQEAPTGVRFASEPKQLVAGSPDGPIPCQRSVLEYLDASYEETRFSFFEGIHRVRPAHVMIASPQGLTEQLHWDISGLANTLEDHDDIPGQFREVVVESLRRRLATSTGAVSDLSGGLDSSSIAAAAEILESRGELPAPFETSSGLFPGHSNDETRWIRDIAALQTLPHHEFVPRIGPVSLFDDDMWASGQPWVDRDRDLWYHSTEIAHAAGADLALTGNGGDHVLHQEYVLFDYLRGRHARRWLSGVRGVSQFENLPATTIAAHSVRPAIPTWARRLRRRRRPIGASTLVNPELRHSLASVEARQHRKDWGMPSMMQNKLLADAQHPMLSWINESHEAEHAAAGIGISHPYFDRDVYEFVLSIPLEAFPFDGRSKTLVRQGFKGHLPQSVLNRTSVTITDEYLSAVFAVHAPQYRERYPSVTSAAAPFVDASTYGQLMTALAQSKPLGPQAENELWRSWTLMAWLESFDRFTPSQ